MKHSVKFWFLHPLKAMRIWSIVAVLGVSSAVLGATAPRAEAGIITGFIVATPFVWAVRTLLFSREAH